MFTILTETVLGALTGYVTNDIATRQLFRRGGIIEREREEFTDMLVDMLSTEILGPEIMAEIFSDPKVEELFQRVAITLVDDVIPQVLADVKLKDGFTGTMLYDSYLAKIDGTTWPELRWNTEILKRHLDAFLRSEDLHQEVRFLLERIAEQSPSDLGFWPWVRNCILSHPLLNQSTRLSWLDENEERLRSRIHDAMLTLEKNDRWHKAPLGEWLHIDAGLLCEQVLILLKDEEVMTSACDMWRSWWLHDEAREWSGEFLHRILEEITDLHLPDVLAALVSALQEDREMLEGMILRSVEAALEGASFEPAVLSALREWFAGDGESDWLTHFFIEQSHISKQRNLCSHVVTHIEGSILPKWQAMWTDNHSGASIIGWLREHADELLRPLILILADNFLKRPPALLLDMLIERERLEDWLWQLLKHQVLEEHWADALKAQLAIVMSKPLKDTFLTKALQLDILQRMKQLPEAIDSEAMIKGLAARPLSSEKIVRRWGERIFDTSLLDGASIIMEHTPANAVLQEIFSKNMSNYVMLSIPDKLADMTHKQIDALSHDELRELALSIIGREMRPLAWLGGAVGSVVGAASGTLLAIGGNYVDPADSAIWLQSGLFAARSGMYGAVGYGTNVLAVKGLFRPYEKHFIFQGLLPKNQSRFADKMKDLTQEYVINEEIWQEMQADLGSYAKHQSHERLAALADHWLCYSKDNKERFLNLLQKIELKTILYALDLRHLLEKAIHYAMRSEKWHQMARKNLELLIVKMIHKTFFDGNVLSLSPQKLFSQIQRLSQAEEMQQLEKELWRKMLKNDEMRLRKGLMFLADQIRMPRSESSFYEACWHRLESKYDDLPSYLAQNAQNLSSRISHAIREKMSFSMDLMFRLIGGEGYVYKAFEYFAIHELPEYLESRRSHYKHTFLTLSYDELAERSLAEIGVVPSGDDARFVKSLLSDEKRCENTAQWLHDHIWRQWFPAIFETMDWVSLRNDFFYWITQENGRNMIAGMAKWLNEALDHLLMQLSEDQISTIADYMDDVLKSPLAKDAMSLTLSDIFSNDSFSALYDAVVIFKDEKSEKEFIQALSGRMGVILDDAWPILAPLVDRFGKEFLREIQLPDVTYRQVCGLDSAHLEDLVRQIANPYFHHVERMGWFGAVVAIPATWMAIWLQ